MGDSAVNRSHEDGNIRTESQFDDLDEKNGLVLG
jgi:hypothetical protein